MTATTEALLPTSAHLETVWARALRDGLERHGATPMYDELVAEFNTPRLEGDPICTCPVGHDAHTFEGQILADYCPTHGRNATELP